MKIREYFERYDVKIVPLSKLLNKNKDNNRLVIHALNEGGFNSTVVDLEDVLMFTKKNYPELWDKINNDKK